MPNEARTRVVCGLCAICISISAAWYYFEQDAFSRVDLSASEKASPINEVSIGDDEQTGRGIAGASGNKKPRKIEGSSDSESKLQKVIRVFTEFEKKTSRVIYDRDFDNGKKIVIALIPPGLTEIEQASGRLSESLSNEPDASVRNNLRVVGERLMREYSVFKKPIKVLHLWVPSNDSIPVTFSEYFVETIEEGTPAENGDFKVPVDSMKHDTAFGEGDSWFALRYSHLIDKPN